MKEDITTQHFEFRNWKQAKSQWIKNNNLYEGQIQFVISTHPYSSGYWIESLGKDLTHGDRVMKTNGSVMRFFRELEKHIDKVHNEQYGY